MDIIPVKSSKRIHFEVPYLIDESQPYVYDNEQFVHFPERMGWDKHKELFAINSGNTVPDSEKTPQRAAALTQAWLFFGIIHYVTRIPVKTEAYITRSESGRQIITLRPLLGVIEDWNQNVKSATDKDRTQYTQSIESQLEAIGNLFTNCIGFSTAAIPSEVSLSIVMLFKILMLAKKFMLPNSAIPREHYFGDWDERLKGQLIDHGWCKGDITRLSDRLSSVHRFCLISLGSHISTRDHSLCTDSECRSLQHEMRHAQPDCKCDAIGPLEGRVTPMINDDCLPLLIVDEKGNLKIQPVKDVFQTPILSYVAISHLCADGLGDPDQNTMFRCQLQLLQSRVNEVVRQLMKPHEFLQELCPFPFWIDTICVPGHPGAAKNTAISKMKSIYERAVAVLVIDKEFDKVKALSSRLEKTLLIATSLWWTRMWTLQEGIFARHLFFQFGDGPITLQSLTGIRDEDENPRGGEWCPVRPGLIKLLLTGDLVRSLSFDNVAGPVLEQTGGRSIFQRMGYRFASKAEDEPVCLAILLGKDAGAIASSFKDPVERMKKFILMQRNFPSFLLFCWDAGQNIDQEGFRWAPKTLLGRRSLMPPGFSTRHTNEISTDTSHDILGAVFFDRGWADAQGIHVNFPGVRLDMTRLSQLSPNPANVLSVSEEEGGHHWTIHLVRQGSEMSKDWSTISPTSSTAVVMPRAPISLGSVNIGRLVLIQKEEETRIFASVLGTVLVVLRGMYKDQQQVLRQILEKSLVADLLPNNQEWCIG